MQGGLLGPRAVALLQLLCVTSTGLFAGAALVITLCIHGAILALKDRQAGLAFFGDFYKRTAALQAPLAVSALLSAGALLAAGPRTAFLTRALLAVVAFALITLFWTLVVMVPDNNRLVKAGKEPGSLPPKEARRLLVEWGPRHALRTFLSCGAFLFLVYALVL